MLKAVSLFQLQWVISIVLKLSKSFREFPSDYNTLRYVELIGYLGTVTALRQECYVTTVIVLIVTTTLTTLTSEKQLFWIY